jgi:8-amino-7-oxononanoate synthase
MFSAENILSALSRKSLRRQLRTLDETEGTLIRIEDRTLVNFASNDYLGLSQHPALREAAKQAIDRFGVGTGASRLITGSTALHARLEEQLSLLKTTEAALTFSSGYAAALGTIPSVVTSGDVIILDKLSHACLIDAAKLSGATIRVYPHNDLTKLRDHLVWAKQEYPDRTILILTESVFSMDGDLGALSAIVDLKDRFGAMLFVDEAHATGIFGKQGEGLIHQLRLSDRVEIQMGTLSKAIGVSGGFICGSRSLIDLLINRARSFIYSTAPPPAVAATASAAVDLIQSSEGDGLRERLWKNIRYLWQVLPGPHRTVEEPSSPIVPIMVGEESKAVAMAAAILESGYFAPAIRYPTVKRGSARLRVTVSSAHSEEQIDGLAKAIDRESWIQVARSADPTHDG